MEFQQVIDICVDDIRTNPFQPRKDFDEEGIRELSESISVHGLIQPILVRSTAGGYQIIAGERRLRASKLAGLGTVKAVVVDIDGVDVAELSLIENIQRKNLNCIEEASAYSILKTKFGMTQEELSERLGKSRSYIANILRLLELPDILKERLFEGIITMGHGRSLLSLPTDELRMEVLERIIKDSLSVRQTESLVRDILSGAKISKPRKAKVQKYFKDARIFYNTLRKAIIDIKEAGGKADMIERETDDFLEITVRIPRGTAMIPEFDQRDVEGQE